MNDAIAWIDGTWGDASTLSLPLSDRGLQLADGLFETLLILEGQPKLLQEHLQRWRDSAALLGMDPPPGQGWLTPLINAATERAGLQNAAGALRLNWSRDASGWRGVSPPAQSSHRFWLTLQPCSPNFKPVSVITSRWERRNAASLISRCKTFGYAASIQARREAVLAGADDALLLNTAGDLCCSSVANLLVKRQGQWLTPPLASGCLPGVMRGRALRLGLVEEGDLGANLQSNDQAVLINSLACRPVTRVDTKAIDQDGLHEGIWRSLLD